MRKSEIFTKGKVVINSLKSAKNDIKQFYTRKKYCQNCPNVREKPPNWRKPEKSGDKCLKKRNKKIKQFLHEKKILSKLSNRQKEAPKPEKTREKW